VRNLTARAVGRLSDKFQGLDRRIAAYRVEPVQDWRAHDLVIRAIDCRAIIASQVPDVVQEWRGRTLVSKGRRDRPSADGLCATKPTLGLKKPTIPAQIGSMNGICPLPPPPSRPIGAQDAGGGKAIS
jgi:hypothetical protein